MKGKKFMAGLTAAIIGVIVAAIYYYIELPAINIHAPGFWKFIIFVMLVVLVIYYIAYHAKGKEKYTTINGKSVKAPSFEFKSSAAKLGFKILAGITIAFVAIFLVGGILSSEIVNATKYQKLLNVEDRSFTEDIKEVSYNQIPILDKDSAEVIGNRVMGTMVDMVSQFEVSDMYSQINYVNKPVRVSPLEYGSIIKWFTNNSEGIPAYIEIDMTSQEAQCVRLAEGMKYTKSDHFGRNIYRQLRFAYPTYIFDDINFEIDETGTPYWVCPVKKYNIGLFGGVTVGRVVLCNAVTGEMTDYAVEDVPTWVDKVFSADLLIELYDYHGFLKHGFINSVLGQRDCLQTTDGYNYIALDDDVWVYTGVTSVGQDKSNVGFVLMNQRTMETRYYTISGAEENSAMSSAEGRVQNLGYKATFPLLVNVGGQPTYFMALKDDAGLVKSYAMLNIEKYQNVAIGDSVLQCETNYRQLMSDNGIVQEEVIESKSKTGTVSKIATAVVDGNSHYYILLDGSSVIYDVNVADHVEVILVNVGDSVTLEYQEGEQTNSVTAMKVATKPAQ